MRPMSPLAVLMKRKMLTGATIWLLLISVMHVQLNLGWGAVKNKVLETLGMQRRELHVGFLPVT